MEISVLDVDPWPAHCWSQALRLAIRSSEALLEILELPQECGTEPTDFPVLVPRSFIQRMKPGDPTDPLLLQVLATSNEDTQVPGFELDPLRENQGPSVSPAPGLLQKYHGRALLITTSGCAVNCRYCFRRHFPYTEHRDKDFRQAIEHLRSDSSIVEVILSGGDPLLLSDLALQNLFQALADIPHLKRIRIHSRIPIVLPERLTEGLCRLLDKADPEVILVVHSNHAQELNEDTARAFRLLAGVGVTLLNQSVLLRGVNDQVNVLCDLSETLFAQGVLPYYLFLPDRVAGTAHFFVTDDEGGGLHEGMQSRLPGYLVPRLAREIPARPHKVLIGTEPA